MGIFDRFNKGTRKTIMEGVDTSDMPFVKLKDFAGQDIIVKGFFFTKGKYGKSVVVVGESVLINMPSYATDRFLELQEDDVAMEAVLSGKLVLTDIEEVSAKNGKTVSFTFKEV